MVLKNKVKKILVVSSLSIVVIFSSIMVYSLQTMHIENLISHAYNNGHDAEKADIFTDLSKFYLENFRIAEDDVQQLQADAGITFILGGSNDYKYQIAEAFLKEGLDINGINHSSYNKLNALHSAVLLGDKGSVLFLLEHGINLNAKTEEGFTALDWAIKMQESDPTEKRDEIIQILETAINS